MKVLGRYIDQHAQHVVITRQGDVVRHTRFTKQAAADEFADSDERVAPHVARPMPDSLGKRPSRGVHSCAVCGRLVKRVGRAIATDGVRGQWKHIPDEPAGIHYGDK